MNLKMKQHWLQRALRSLHSCTENTTSHREYNPTTQHQCFMNENCIEMSQNLPESTHDETIEYHYSCRQPNTTILIAAELEFSG
jgi:hypothetical protein